MSEQMMQADVRPLWKAQGFSARRSRNAIAVEQTRGQLVTVAALNTAENDGCVDVLVRGRKGRTVKLTATPAPFGGHGAIPFEQGGVIGMVWTVRTDSTGLFGVIVATEQARVGRIVKANLSEEDALDLALRLARGKEPLPR